MRSKFEDTRRKAIKFGAHGTTVNLIEFVRLGGLTVPLGLLASTVGLWLALHVV